MRRISVAAACAMALSVATVVGQQPAPVRDFDLTLTPEHVHWGYYDSQVTPVLRVPSVSRIHVETMVAGGTQRLRLAGATDAEIPDALKAVEQRITQRGPGVHPLTGPIFVEGAEPGDTLEVRIVSIDFLHPFGVVTFNPGTSQLPNDFPYAQYKLLRWKPGAQTIEFKPGVTLRIAPFWGSIGVAPPPLAGRISSRPPGWHGGNLDNKDFADATQLGQVLHDSPALTSCLVKRAYSYATGGPTNANDNATLAYFDERFAHEGYRLPGLMRALALSAAFERVRPAPTPVKTASLSTP